MSYHSLSTVSMSVPNFLVPPGETKAAALSDFFCKKNQKNPRTRYREKKSEEINQPLLRVHTEEALKDHSKNIA